MSDEYPEPTVEERLAQFEALLKEVAEVVGVNASAPSPDKAWRYERPLISHASDIRDLFHEWNQSAHILIQRVETLIKTVDRSALVSISNADGIKKIEELSHKIADHSTLISRNMKLALPEKPLLMRELFWVDTNAVEIGLIAYTAAEAIQHLIGSETLLRSALFRAMSLVIPSPTMWGVLMGFTSVVALVSFACRKRQWRMFGASLMAVYFGVTSFLPLFVVPGALGWLPHLLAWTGALWILIRGPAGATQ